jgi:hypothetical protein
LLIDELGTRTAFYGAVRNSWADDFIFTSSGGRALERITDLDGHMHFQTG